MISVVGLGMATQTGVAEKMFRALAEKGINILMITTSEIKISVLVQRQFAQEALRTVHEAFQLDREPAEVASAGDGTTPRSQAGNAAEIVARMERMEQLLIEDITLDHSQARVTAVDLPDMPGLAAQVLAEIAEAGIVVDMIVQSIGREGHANISFTVAQEDLPEAVRVTTGLAEVLHCPPPTSCPKVAKLSVFGVGIRSHTDVASRMFQSLTAAGINVDMISTSEVRINVVVDGRNGQQGLAALKKEFADVMV